jgi:hypothetical protein
MRILIILMLSGTLGVLGCATDETSDNGGDGGSGGEGGAGGGASAEAIDFCGRYDTTCGFGETDRYADEAACLDAYDNSGQSTCYETHLGLAGSDAGTHCPHATGIGECPAP